MLGWIKALMPKEERFFQLFVQHATLVLAGADALRNVLNGGPDVERYCRIVSHHEHEADQIARQTLIALRRSFITPFDRADIQDLIGSLDDAIDQMNRATKSIMLYDMRVFEPQMQQIGDIIQQSSRIVLEAMPLLADIPQHANRLSGLTEEVTRHEDRADELHELGRKILFGRSRDANGSGLDYIIGTEIYNDLEAVVDRLEDVSNEINALIVDQL